MWVNCLLICPKKHKETPGWCRQSCRDKIASNTGIALVLQHSSCLHICDLKKNEALPHLVMELQIEMSTLLLVHLAHLHQYSQSNQKIQRCECTLQAIHLSNFQKMGFRQTMGLISYHQGPARVPQKKLGFIRLRHIKNWSKCNC